MSFAPERQVVSRLSCSSGTARNPPVAKLSLPNGKQRFSCELHSCSFEIVDQDEDEDDNLDDAQSLR